MKSPLFRRPRQKDTIAALYGMIVAQARSPAFYRDYGVPDTVNGRLEMILLHTFLFFRRVAGEAAPVRALGQQVFDVFCRDMDGNLREMGVGDLAVPGQMRQIGEAFYGRAAALEAALAAGDDQVLTDTVTRNVFSGSLEHLADARRLATYIRETLGHLARQDGAAFTQGRVSFPDPEALAAWAKPLPSL